MNKMQLPQRTTDYVEIFIFGLIGGTPMRQMFRHTEIRKFDTSIFCEHNIFAFHIANRGGGGKSMVLNQMKMHSAFFL